MTYKRTDGSYSAFGERDSEGSTWYLFVDMILDATEFLCFLLNIFDEALFTNVKNCSRLTAFVLKSYAQAQPWIDVDQKEINDPVNWLLKKQDGVGCFPTIGNFRF